MHAQLLTAFVQEKAPGRARVILRQEPGAGWIVPAYHFDHEELGELQAAIDAALQLPCKSPPNVAHTDAPGPEHDTPSPRSSTGPNGNGGLPLPRLLPARCRPGHGTPLDWDYIDATGWRHELTRATEDYAVGINAYHLPHVELALLAELIPLLKRSLGFAANPRKEAA